MTAINPRDKRVTRLSITLILVLFAFCTEQSDDEPTIPMNWQPVDSLNVQLPDGIRLYAGFNEILPLRAWYVTIDEKQDDIFTRVVVSDDPTDNRETVSSFASDLNAYVVVNGGYFTMNQTLAEHHGLLISKGVLVAPATDVVTRDSIQYQTARAALGFSGEDQMDIIWATTRNDTLFAWSSPPAHLPGRPAEPLQYKKAKPLQMRDAIGAGPALIMDGKIQIASDEEVFFGSSIPQTHPRTAIGYTRKGDLIILVVDGRQSESRGVNLEELASLMFDLDAFEAMNLDGGGSSTLVVAKTLVNRPTGGTFQRQVMSAIATFSNSAMEVKK